MVVSFGVNDTTVVGGGPGSPPERSVANLRALLDGGRGAARLPVLVVGPPPVADRAQNRRIAALDAQLAARARRSGARPT